MKHPFVANANKTGVIQNNVPNSYISTLDIYTVRAYAYKRMCI
jgi:hypothetical protein